MSARIGADELDLFASPRPALLREITGIEPEPAGVHVLLDEHAGVRSTQRLALADVGGSILVALWPGELKSQASYLYEEGRALAMLVAARERSWSVEPSPHLAFFNSHAAQRLYMKPAITAEEYARRWEGRDGRMIGRHPHEALTTIIVPWLQERGYLDDGDAAVVEQFTRILGRRRIDVRPGLRFKRRWEASGSSESQLAKAIREDVNGILAAAGEPSLPAGLRAL